VPDCAIPKRSEACTGSASVTFREQCPTHMKKHELGHQKPPVEHFIPQIILYTPKRPLLLIFFAKAGGSKITTS
jgi:hypothetical protein